LHCPVVIGHRPVTKAILSSGLGIDVWCWYRMCEH
jgi:hypothetical protein